MSFAIASLWAIKFLVSIPISTVKDGRWLRQRLLLQRCYCEQRTLDDHFIKVRSLYEAIVIFIFFSDIGL
ncbi:hypothetical protein H6G04_27485 [Calothrix membranacea FACHB-236]|nr:hypothetical protein [Calothrix membranacea FACHB-236]